MRFRPSVDIVLIQSTLEHRALLVRYGNIRAAWDRVSEQVNAELNKTNHPENIDARRCQERVRRLLEIHREQNLKVLYRMGTNEEYAQLTKLLQQLASHEEERKKNKRSDEPAPHSAPLASMGVDPSLLAGPPPLGASQLTMLAPKAFPTHADFPRSAVDMEMILGAHNDWLDTSKLRKVAVEDLMASSLKVGDLFAKFILQQTMVLEQIRSMLGVQMEREE